ncbi:MAG: hypothetical protein CMO80_15470 [Verrucomicrobiales bacterium]|nr:hypothetical protein [Verrucomicrobiales bacterium]|tara:strand:+ start:3941 stop:6856 length:2916 start_codon:yes stop_codon:yes gene_type:complete
MTLRTLQQYLMVAICLGLLPEGANCATGVFENRGTTNNAQVDACVFINSGQFTVIDNSFRALPYQTRNTSLFTNEQGGVMSFQPGVILELVTNNTRVFMDSFVNFGDIRVSGLGRFDARSRNVVSSGNISSSTGGRVRLEGNNISVERGALSALIESNVTTDVRLFQPLFFSNPRGVEDIYWGGGIGGQHQLLSVPSSLSIEPTQFGLASAITPIHEVIYPASGAVSTLSNLLFTNHMSFVYTQQIALSNLSTTVVIINTNPMTTNMTIDVRFDPSYLFAPAPVIQLGHTDTNFRDGTIVTNKIYFIDHLLDQTNTPALLTIADNTNDVTFRPRNYQISRGSDFDFYFSNSTVVANSVQTNDTFFRQDFSNTFTTNYRYSAYAARIGDPVTNAMTVFGDGGNLALSDVTNLPGRVEIFSDSLNMRLSRLEAENTIIINTENLQDSSRSLIKAPNVIFNVKKANDTLALTNFVPASVPAFNGFIEAFSASWTNQSGPQSFTYHVLMLDVKDLAVEQAVRLPSLNLSATNLVVQNILNAGRSFVFDSPAVTFQDGTELRLNLNTIPNLLPTNFPSMTHFTNSGIITVPGLADFVGPAGSSGLTKMITDGTILANALNITASSFQSSGTNGTAIVQPSGIIAGGGPLRLVADSAKLESNTNAPGRFFAGGSIDFRANVFELQNQRIETPGKFFLNATNSIKDRDGLGNNLISTGLGFESRVKPPLGDLRGTTIEITVGFNDEVTNVWPAADVGPFIGGFTNNLAVGKLVIDTTNNFLSTDLTRFEGASVSNAIYIDFLELRGQVTNDLAGHLSIADNMRIYFANSNVDIDLLNGALGGKIQWVKDYAGLNSGIIVNVDGRTFLVNEKKFNSRTVDSDGDGQANAVDQRPFEGVVVKTNVVLSTVTTNLGVNITWEAAANTVYRIEANTNLNTTNWVFVTSFTNTATSSGDVSLQEIISATNRPAARYYRISYVP